MPKTQQCESPNMVPFVPFEEYSRRYESIFVLDRSESGVVTARFHTDGGPAVWDYPLHRGIGQLTRDVAQDPESEVFIIGGTGDRFVAPGETSIEETPENLQWALYEHNYYDGVRMVEGLVNELEQQSIGVVNGFAVHSEIATLCDITLMAEDAVIMDPHFPVAGGIPGDGVQIAMRAYMGIKKANYALITGEKITAEKALEYGLVSEVVPADKLYERASELGEMIASKPRLNRRMLTQILRQPVKEQIARELRATFGSELWGNLTTQTTHDEAFAELNKHM